jgi:hypothetical protein
VTLPADFLCSATSMLAGPPQIGMYLRFVDAHGMSPIVWKCGVDSVHGRCNLQTCSGTDGNLSSQASDRNVSLESRRSLSFVSKFSPQKPRSFKLSSEPEILFPHLLGARLPPSAFQFAIYPGGNPNV